MRRRSTNGRGRRGQVIVLGAIGLLIMVLGIISTLNLGQAVQERIRLQNAADAAAYSLAVDEARLFNFFAFTNRAQVAHYSAAMTIQSYISYMTYVGGVVGTLRDLLWDTASVYSCVCALGIVVPPISPPHCFVAPFVAAIGNILAGSLTKLRAALTASEVVATQLIEAMQIFNRVIFSAQLYQGLMINLVLTSGGYPYVWANAPEVGLGVANGLNALFNQLEFWRVFDRGAGVNFSLLGLLTHPRDLWSPRINNPLNLDDDVQMARQVMTEIANASRWGPPSPKLWETFVTDRTLTLPVPMYAPFAGLPGLRGGQTRLVGRAGLDVSDVTGLPPRLGVALPQMRTLLDDNFDGSVLASDDYLISKPFVSASFVFPTPFPSFRVGAAMVADRKGGGHYGYNWDPQPSWVPGVMRLPPDVPPPTSPLLPVQGCCLSLGPSVLWTFPPASNLDYVGHVPRSHFWDGITPFAKFAPSSTPEWDYRQPSTWIFLNLPPEHFNKRGAGPAPGSALDLENAVPDDRYSFGSQAGDRPWSLELEYTFGDRTARLDTTPGTGNSALLPMFRGLNAISRGQVYYHRPRPGGQNSQSNWTEHPNFFNPYWRARLAPVGLKLVQTYEYLIANRVHLGINNPVLRGGTNFLRNAMSEVFFHVVTSVMTH